jgi:chromate transporter
MRTSSSDPTRRSRLLEVAALFLRLGFTAFGGPAAHVAIMRDEVVTKHKWISEQEFLDLFGAANLIPGPTSTETAIYLGYKRLGWMGLVLAGICFILPAMLIVLALSWAYVRYGTTTWANGILYGIMPVVMAIITQALWALGKKAVKNWLTGIVGAGVVILYMLGVNVIILLLLSALIVMIGENLSRIKRMPVIGFIMSLRATLSKVEGQRGNLLFTRDFRSLVDFGSLLATSTPFNLTLLFLNFLKIGATLYGSGYVLLAYLRSDFVLRLGWLTDKQLIDAIAIGQITPGPLFTTATFIGYLLGGMPGAMIATLGIFLPSFFFVAIVSLFINRIRNSPWTASLLDGVNAASLGLMLAVSIQLASTALMDPMTITVALICLFILIRSRTNSTWLIAGGALIGLIHTLF